MSILLVFLIFICVLLLPIPFKLTIHFSKNCFYVKFYNILLFSPEKGVLNKLKKKIFIEKSSKPSNKSTSKNNNNKKKTSNPLNKRVKKKTISFIKLYKNIVTNKFKPSFKFEGDVNFALEDAALTAITYGASSNIIPLLYFILSKPFKVKKFSLQINPHFTGNNLLNFTISSIISLSIAQIIYILVLTIKSLENKEEVDP